MFLNDIMNTMIRSLPMATRRGIALGLFLASLIFFNKSIRKKSELRPIRIGWFVLFLLCFTLSVIYLEL
jgi:hypothetical protein